MVNAIIDETKVQTRRLIKEKSTVFNWLESGFTPEFICSDGNEAIRKYNVGDIIWVREKWRHNETKTGFPHHHYADKNVFTNRDSEKWKPSIHMPKEACRIFLEVKSVRIERLQQISEHDAIAEGIEMVKSSIIYPAWANYNLDDIEDVPYYSNPIDSFKSLWESIYGRQSWASNPWVYAIEFEIIQLNYEQMTTFLQKK